MNNKGFIATSLIYSFFLIFITLFLTIIADYLQNKVLLNTIEKGIKDELNTNFTVLDFEVGDMVSFVNDCANVAYASNQWVVVKIDYTNNPETSEYQKVILYSYDFDSEPFDSSQVDKLNYSYLENDIELGYRNATYLNKILYTFNLNIDAYGDPRNKDYSLSYTDAGNTVDKMASIACDTTTTNEYVVESNCIKNGTPTESRYRYRYEYIIGNGNIPKCKIENSSIIYLEYKKDVST